MKDLNMEILYEDNHLIAINKPCGLLVQGDKTGDKPLVDLVKEYIKVKYEKPGDVYLGLPHRLDRPASGIVLLTRTSKASSRMSELFRENELSKTYWAIVKDRPEKDQARLSDYLIKDRAKNKSVVVSKERKGARLAELEYRYVASTNRYHLLEVSLITGRHHQIRAQLSHIGCPIKGDLKYGANRSNPDGGISLHARKLEFVHPVTKEKISIVADPPQDVLWGHFMEKMVGTSVC